MADATDHSRLMDETYRYQRLFYDVTRKYYLLGRDHLIRELNAKPSARVLEVACGTGRNLAKIRKRYPEAKVYGFDISEQMLVTARSKLGSGVPLAQGNACDFDPVAMFGVEDFDHIVLSFSLSMIPDWQNALAEATRHLAPGGQLHVVDFGESSRLPSWFQRGLLAWLSRFHVAPRVTLEAEMRKVASSNGSLAFYRMYRDYTFYGRVLKNT